MANCLSYSVQHQPTKLVEVVNAEGSGWISSDLVDLVLKDSGSDSDTECDGSSSTEGSAWCKYIVLGSSVSDGNNDLLCVISCSILGLQCSVNDVLKCLSSEGTASSVWHGVNSILDFFLCVGVGEPESLINTSVVSDKSSSNTVVSKFERLEQTGCERFHLLEVVVFDGTGRIDDDRDIGLSDMACLWCLAWFLVEVTKMSCTTTSAHVVTEVAVALGRLEGASWVLDIVVVASLCLFATLEDLFHTSVDSDFVLARLGVIRADLDWHGVAFVVGAGTVTVVTCTTAGSAIAMKTLTDWARAHVASIGVCAVVLATTVVVLAFIDVQTTSIFKKVVSLWA